MHLRRLIFLEKQHTFCSYPTLDSQRRVIEHQQIDARRDIYFESGWCIPGEMDSNIDI